MDIEIIEHMKETLSVVIQCNKIDDEVMRLKSHIESFDNKLYAQKDGRDIYSVVSFYRNYMCSLFHLYCNIPEV